MQTDFPTKILPRRRQIASERPSGASRNRFSEADGYDCQDGKNTIASRALELRERKSERAGPECGALEGAMQLLNELKRVAATGEGLTPNIGTYIVVSQEEAGLCSILSISKRCILQTGGRRETTSQYVHPHYSTVSGCRLASEKDFEPPARWSARNPRRRS